MTVTKLWFCWIVTSGLLWRGVSCSKEEKALIKTLLGDYDVNVRPVEHPKDMLTISMDLTIKQLLNLDEKNQILSGNYWIDVYWTDAALRWDPAAYAGIETVRISVTRIWRPDLTLNNDVSQVRRRIEELYPARIMWNGSVTWSAPIISHSSCPLDVTYYPWDRQNCELCYSSWTYDGYSMDIYNNTPSGIKDYFLRDGEWILTDFPVRREVGYFPAPFPNVTYTVMLQRKPLYSLYNIVIPCIFVTFCACMVFVLPPECGEKVSMSVTMLLSSTFFLMVVAENMPPQSDVIPLVGKYFLAVILMLVLSTVASVAVLWVHHQQGCRQPLPLVARKLLLQWLATALCMKATVKRVRNEREAKYNNKNNNRASLSESISNISGNINSILRVPSDHTMNESPCTRRPSQSPHASNPSYDHSATDEEIYKEWVTAAMVLDRLFLWIFSIGIILMTALILTDHP